MGDDSYDPVEFADYGSDGDRTYCPQCGLDTPGCGCSLDLNTCTKRRCTACGSEWWDAQGERREACWRCGRPADGAATVREPLYAVATAGGSRG